MFTERDQSDHIYRDGDYEAVITSTGGTGTMTYTSSSYTTRSNLSEEMVVDFGDLQNLQNVEGVYVSLRGSHGLASTGTTGRVRIRDVTNGTSLTDTEVTTSSDTNEPFQSPREKYNPGGVVKFRIECKVDDGSTDYTVAGNPNVIVYALIDRGH